MKSITLLASLALGLHGAVVDARGLGRRVQCAVSRIQPATADLKELARIQAFIPYHAQGGVEHWLAAHQAQGAALKSVRLPETGRKDPISFAWSQMSAPRACYLRASCEDPFKGEAVYVGCKIHQCDLSQAAIFMNDHGQISGMATSGFKVAKGAKEPIPDVFLIVDSGLANFRRLERLAAVWFLIESTSIRSGSEGAQFDVRDFQHAVTHRNVVTVRACRL